MYSASQVDRELIDFHRGPGHRGAIVGADHVGDDFQHVTSAAKSASENDLRKLAGLVIL